jgi:hypothetical protein
MEGRRGKENVRENEKYWSHPSIYEYNIMQWTTFLNIREHGDRMSK